MQHKWNCIVSIPITEAEATEALASGVVNRDVTLKDVEFMGMGCIVCEEPLTAATIKSNCPGEPEQ